MDFTPYTYHHHHHNHHQNNKLSSPHSSNNNHHNNNIISSTDESTALDTMHRSNNHSHTSTSRSSDSSEPNEDGKWAPKLLRECAKAISDRDSSKAHHLLWMLNELASPYGDCDQKLASYFLQALFCRATQSGQRCYKTLSSVAHKNHSFDSARKLILKFQEVSPWTTFGHVASNGAILEALEGEPKLHIIDISNTLCTQWPTLLEALATRNDDTPHLKLTVVALTGSLMKEVGQRMEKFARLMGVPFQFNLINGLNQITKESLGVQDDEAIAVNCVGALRRVQVEDRENLIRLFKSLSPKVVTVVEEEADFITYRQDFVKCFEECLKFYSLYFEMLEESFPPTSNERLMLERECSRSIVRVLACCGGGDGGASGDDNNNNNNNNNELEDGEFGDCCERRERGMQWCERLRNVFKPFVFSDDVVDDVKALLKRYQPGWSLMMSQGDDHVSGIYLTWKDEPVVWASAWKP